MGIFAPHLAIFRCTFAATVLGGIFSPSIPFTRLSSSEGHSLQSVITDVRCENTRFLNKIYEDQLTTGLRYRER